MSRNGASENDLVPLCVEEFVPFFSVDFILVYNDTSVLVIKSYSCVYRASSFKHTASLFV